MLTVGKRGCREFLPAVFRAIESICQDADVSPVEAIPKPVLVAAVVSVAAEAFGIWSCGVSGTCIPSVVRCRTKSSLQMQPLLASHINPCVVLYTLHGRKACAASSGGCISTHVSSIVSSCQLTHARLCEPEVVIQSQKDACTSIVTCRNVHGLMSICMYTPVQHDILPRAHKKKL